MRTLIALCLVSVLTLFVLAVLYLNHFGQPYLGLPPGANPVIALTVLAVNIVVAALAVAYRRRGPALAWTTTVLALVQVAAVMVTG